MTFVRQIATKVTVLAAGATRCEGTVQEVQNDPRVIEVYLGQDREEYAPDREPVGILPVPAPHGDGRDRRQTNAAVRVIGRGIGPWPEMGRTMLQVDNLSVAYGETLDPRRDVNLTIGPGEVVCLMGRNGVGKTTLLKSIMGLLPTSPGGSSSAAARPVRDSGPASPNIRALAGISYVPLGREIFPANTVLENLKVGLMANLRKPRDRSGQGCRSTSLRCFRCWNAKGVPQRRPAATSAHRSAPSSQSRPCSSSTSRRKGSSRRSFR